MKFGVFAIIAAIWTFGASASAMNYSCLGTEPFWSLTLTDQKMSFRTPDMQDEPKAFETKVVGRDVAVGAWADYAFEVMGDNGARVSVIRNDQCTDGMSESAYTHSVLLRLGPVLLAGCCKSAVEQPRGRD